VFSEDVMDALIIATKHLKMKALEHLKIEMRMTRIGLVNSEEIIHLANKAYRTKGILLEGIFTHFADADNHDSTYTRIQFSRFKSILEELSQHKKACKILCCHVKRYLDRVFAFGIDFATGMEKKGNYLAVGDFFFHIRFSLYFHCA